MYRPLRPHDLPHPETTPRRSKFFMLTFQISTLALRGVDAHAYIRLDQGFPSVRFPVRAGLPTLCGIVPAIPVFGV